MSVAPRIVLVGYRGSGKSVVGETLARSLDWTFVDADAVLESRCGKSISDLFATEGETGFRDRETELLVELCHLENRVIATGGGVILRAENRKLLVQSGFVAWLSAPPEFLWDRIRTDPVSSTRRPNLTASGGLQEVANLLAIREPHYRAVASAEFPTAGRSPEAVASDILAAWRIFSSSR